MSLSLRNKSAARAAVGYALDGKGRISKIEKLADEFFQVEIKFPGDREINLYITRRSEATTKSLDAAEEKYRAFFESAPRSHDYWKTCHRGDSLAIGIKRLAVIDGHEALVMTFAPDDREIIDVVRGIENRLLDPQVAVEAEAQAGAGSAGRLGPIVAGLALILDGVQIFGAPDPVFALGNSSSVELPNAVAAGLFLVMGLCAFARKIGLTYYFLVFNVFKTIAVLIGVHFVPSIQLSAETASLIDLAISGFLVVFLPFRARDFGHERAGDFFKSVFTN